MEITEAKKQVIKAGKELVEKGLIARTWGNVSCRTDEEHFVISASGKNYETLTEDEVIELNMELEYEGDIKPSSEKKIHREIYRLREDAGFVIHTHQHNASAVSAMGLEAIRLDKEYEYIGNFVLCAGYGLPGTDRITNRVRETVKESPGNAVIMSNHGAVCFGKNYEEAFKAAENLEEACGRYLEYIGVEPWNGEEKHFENEWNDSPVILKYIEHRDRLMAYLDDFAQMIGPSLKVIEGEGFASKEAAVENDEILLVRGKGALCSADNIEDRIAISMLIEKNCRAALAGIGCKPIGLTESIVMRQVYKKKYSKLKTESEND